MLFKNKFITIINEIYEINFSYSTERSKVIDWEII